jgi:hypothetical protein
MLCDEGGLKMKIAKWSIYSLAMISALVLAATPVAQAGQGLEDWPVNPAAKGDRSTGQLTIYYEVIPDNPAKCTGEESVKMLFFLRLYEKKTKTWHIITAVNQGPFCLTFDIATRNQQGALEQFLQNDVRPRLTAAAYSQVLLKDVEDAYENISTPPVVQPYCVSAEITIVAQ